MKRADNDVVAAASAGVGPVAPARDVRGPKMRVGFLFNHDAGHQSGHLAPILNAFAATRPNDGVYAFVGGAALKESVLASLSAPNVEIVELSLPPFLGGAARILEKEIDAKSHARLLDDVVKQL